MTDTSVSLRPPYWCPSEGHQQQQQQQQQPSNARMNKRTYLNRGEVVYQSPFIFQLLDLI